MSGARVVDATAVAALLERARREVDGGQLPSCQLAVAIDGDVVVDELIGDTGAGSRYLIYSVTKALVAAAVWRVLGDGPLSAETPVGEVVPEFATNGKEEVRVGHLLDHTGGFPSAPMTPEEGATSAGRVTRFAEWRLDWEPGTATAYHPTSAHWVLAEIVERVRGADHRAVSNEVPLALGLTDLELGVPPERQGDVREVSVVEPDPGEAHVSQRIPETGSDLLLRYNEPAVRAIGVPGAGAVGTAASVALLYQAMLRDEQGLWDPEILRAGTQVARHHLVDPLTRVPANRTLGLTVAGDDGHGWIRGFGRATGPRAFGGLGVGGQVAWADPDLGLSFCVLTDGLDADPVRSFLRGDELSTLAAACGG